MRKRLLLSRLAAVLAAAAVIVSGCYHYMPPQSQMDRSVTESSRQVSRADRAGYTVAMVERALQRYGDEGREATVEYYNSPESVDGEWYVFIVDENDLMIAHADPGRLGQDLKGDLGVDVNGYRFGDQILKHNRGGAVDRVCPYKPDYRSGTGQAYLGGALRWTDLRLRLV